MTQPINAESRLLKCVGTMTTVPFLAKDLSCSISPVTWILSGRSSCALNKALGPLILAALSNLANPKMAVFFASLLPQFELSGLPTVLTMTIYSILFCLMTLVTARILDNRTGESRRWPPRL